MLSASDVKSESRADMSARVAELTRGAAELWWACDARELPPMPEVSAAERADHGVALERFVGQVTAELSAPLGSAAQREAQQQRCLSAFGTLAREALGFAPRHLEELQHGFMPALAAFCRAARRFDARISGADIFQAGRNVSILNGLQRWLGVEVRLTPAATGYSLLYPFTDNLLDDPAVSAESKGAFNERLSRRLMGEEVSPTDAREAAVHALVGMIEAQYPPAQYPAVSAALMAIQRAQVRSVALMRTGQPYDVDVLGISLEKGGTSVLADGYLVTGSLTPAQEEVVFGWGAFLQLADDLQDVDADLRAGLSTVYSQSAGRWPLDALSTRTLHFGARVLDRMAALAGPSGMAMVEMMQRSATLMVLDAVGQARALHTRDYARLVAARFPFSAADLLKARRRLARRRVSFMRLIEMLGSADA